MIKDLKLLLSKKKQIKLIDLFCSGEIRKYIVIGIINSILGYIIGVLTFKLFYESFGIIFVSIFSNMLSIFLSFLNYKLFFFNKSYQNIFKEFFKFNLTYTVLIFFSMFQLFIFIEVLLIDIYLAQAMIILFNLCFLFFSHFFLIFSKNSY